LIDGLIDICPERRFSPLGAVPPIAPKIRNFGLNFCHLTANISKTASRCEANVAHENSCLKHCLKKGCRFYFCNNFGKCRPILIILSLLYSQIYCGWRWY